MKNLIQHGVRVGINVNRPWLFAIVIICCALAVHFWVEHVSAKIIISIKDQKMFVLREGRLPHTYTISTGIAGAGEELDSGKTPRGQHVISEKLGATLAFGQVIKDLLPTDEIVELNPFNRVPVVTRVLRLAGVERANRNTHSRLIYIHGSPVEMYLGQPASGGCIRLRSKDVIELFNLVSVGTKVNIQEASYRAG